MLRAYTNKLLNWSEKVFKTDMRYLTKGGFWLTSTQAVNAISSFIVIIAFANLLSEHTFGVYKYILSIGVLLSAVSLSGLNIAILQAASKTYSGFFQHGIKASLIYSSGIFVAGVIGSIYYIINENPILSIGCLIIAFIQPLASTYQNIFPFLQGQRRFKESAILQSIKAIVVAIVSLITVILTENVLWLVFSFFFSQALTNIVIYRLYRPINLPVLDRKIVDRYLSYAKHASLRNVISNIAYRIDTIIVFQQLGAVELAVYSIATLLPEQIKGAFKNLNTLLLPKFAMYKDVTDIKSTVIMRSLQFLVICIFITGVYFVSAPFIYHLLFPSYTESILLTQILALSLPAMITAIPLNALEAQLDKKGLHILNTQYSLILIILTYILINTHGLMGAILAKVLARYINMAFSFYILLSRKKAATSVEK